MEFEDTIAWVYGIFDMRPGTQVVETVRCGPCRDQPIVAATEMSIDDATVLLFEHIDEHPDGAHRKPVTMTIRRHPDKDEVWVIDGVPEP